MLLIHNVCCRLVRIKSTCQIFSMASVHKMAKDGFTDGSHYNQSRPAYSTEVVNHVVNRLHKSSRQNIKYHILELGAGTGLFTRKLFNVLPKDVKYLATDPSEGFLSVLKSQSPDVEAKVMVAANISLPDESVENIICAQCFHWFATEECLKEMTRVLVPGGRIMLVYNTKRRCVKWTDQMENILTDYYGDTPRKISGKWKEVIENFAVLKFVDHKFMDGTPGVKGDKQFVINHYTSISVIAQLSEEEKKEAISRFQAVVDSEFRDEEEVTLPLESEIYCSEKK